MIDRQRFLLIDLPTVAARHPCLLPYFLGDASG